MLSPDATRDVAAPPEPGAGERELKFTLPAGLAHLARRRLETVCRRDPEFPAAVVWTIYYDTPAFTSLGEKVNSDYLKRKIRVRWYSDVDGQISEQAFVEAKFRMGTRRSKVRMPLPYRAEEIAEWDLQDARLLSFPLLLRDQGVLHQAAWQPMMLIRYRRDRFIESITDSRVSLDADISGVSTNPRFFSASDPSPLATAVLEVKGTGEHLPSALRPLLALGLHKRSFSKFLVVHARMSRNVL